MSTEVLNQVFTKPTNEDSYFSKKVYFRIQVLLNSQNKSNKTSNITINCYTWYLWNSSGIKKKWSSDSSPTQTLYLGNEIKHIKNSEYKLPVGQSSSVNYGCACNPAIEQLINTWTGDVQHDSEGNYYSSVKVSFAKNTNWPSSGESSQPYRFTPINFTCDRYNFELPSIASSSPSIKVNGEWKDGDECFVKVNGEWKVADTCYVKVNGVWKEIV